MRPDSQQNDLYETALRDFGRALDRLAAGYESDSEKRQDLRQEIHFQLWRSCEVFDGRCSFKTWVFRVAHNTAVTYVARERRVNTRFVSVEEIAAAAVSGDAAASIDRERALERISGLIRRLEPLDRQIILCYLEDMDAASISEITGLSPPNVAMKVHRIKRVLARLIHRAEAERTANHE